MKRAVERQFSELTGGYHLPRFVRVVAVADALSGAQERIQGMRKSVAGARQRLQAPKNWIGSVVVNIFQVVCDVLSQVQQMNTKLASHTHGATPVPGNTAVFLTHSSTAIQLGEKLKGVTILFPSVCLMVDLRCAINWSLCCRLLSLKLTSAAGGEVSQLHRVLSAKSYCKVGA